MLCRKYLFPNEVQFSEIGLLGLADFLLTVKSTRRARVREPISTKWAKWCSLQRKSSVCVLCGENTVLQMKIWRLKMCSPLQGPVEGLLHRSWFDKRLSFIKREITQALKNGKKKNQKKTKKKRQIRNTKRSHDASEVDNLENRM